LQKISTKAFYIFFYLLFVIHSAFSQEKVKDDLRKKAQEAAKGLGVLAPDMRSPVSVNAKAIWSDDKKQLAVILKVEVLDNWHIYAHVPPDQPYIESELRLSAPEGLTALEKWETPVPYPYEDGIFVYKGSLLFIRYFSVKKAVENKTVEVGLYYQTCDIRQCLPPELEMVKLIIAMDKKLPEIFE
jgi:hypothetical protein